MPLKQLLQSNKKLLLRILDTVEDELFQQSGYQYQYLRSLLDHKEYYLTIFESMAYEGFRLAGMSPRELVVLDYGCGNGILAIFLSLLGCKQVLACDTNPSFLDLGRKLEKHLGLKGIKWIHGSEDYFVNPSDCQRIDVWIGSDVIEHVYDIAHLLRIISSQNPSVVYIFSTASVFENPWKSKMLKQLMYRDENVDSKAFESEGFLAGKPYLEQRKWIIKDAFPYLGEEKLNNFAEQSRGLARKDIIEKVRSAIEMDGEMEYFPPDEFNTCNPFNGSFTERLLPITEYEKLFKRSGLSFGYQCGFYDSWKGNFGKRLGITLVNICITLLGKLSLPLTPFVIFKGRVKIDQNEKATLLQDI